MKNEATDLYENKGSALARIRNEATVGESHQFSAISFQRPVRSSSTLDISSLFGCPVPRAKKGVMHSQNEGTTHDVDENKGHKKWNVGTTHDVDDNK